MANALVELFKQNLWANLQLLDACEKLSSEQLDAAFPCTYGSIRDTLVHLAGAEELYVNMLLGQPRPPRREGEDFPGFEFLRELLTSTGQQLINVAQNNAIPESYHDIDANEVLTGSMIVILAINHATEHRAHINSTFSHLGFEPTDLDGWAYGYTHDLMKIGLPSS